MKNNVKFSIITPCFNSERTMERTIQSVLKQTYQNYEYIIVDGASTDRTLDIIKKYKKDFENKLKVISEPDKGIYDAMNKGICLSQGEIIGIINSDDFYEDTALEKVISCYDTNKKYQILYGMLRFIDESAEELAIRFIHHRNLERDMINHPGSFVTRKLYQEFGMYDTKYKSASDYDFMIRMSKNPEIYFNPIYEILANFTIGGMSSGYLGAQETLKVKYHYGIIKKKQYLLAKIKNKLKDWIA